MTAAEVDSFKDRAKGEPVVGHYTAVVWANTTDVGCGFIERDVVMSGDTYVGQV